MPWSYFFEYWVLSPLFIYFLKKLCRSSSLSAIRMVLSAYPRLLIFLLSWFQLVIYLAQYFISSLVYKLNKQNNNIQPCCTPFPILNQSIVSCPVLIVASWSSYRLFKRQARWSGIPISLRIFQFVMTHTVKGFSIVNEAEVDVFL